MSMAATRLTLVNPDDLLAQLDPEQREVALAVRGPVRVLAGAGTGKTRAITHRIAYGVAAGIYTPTEVLAVTFTTRAAGEMRSRLRTLGAPGVQARTFHAAALRQVRYFWPKVYGGEPPQLIDSKLGLVGRAAKSQGLPTDRPRLRDVASEIEWSKVSNVLPSDYPARAEKAKREVSGLELDQVAGLYEAYESHKAAQGQMDMEDVLLLASALLSEDAATAATVRAQYQHFVVDEYQDVNPIQQALLNLWLGESQEICVVGDPAQTIYSFAGARADRLLDFTRRYPNATQVELVRNYRSTPQVISIANALLQGTTSRSVALRAVNEPGPEVEWSVFPDEVAEAQGAVARIKELQASGVALSEMAILFRINAASESFEAALSEADIPYVLRGAARFFERQEIRQAMALMRGQIRSGANDADLITSLGEVLTGLGWTAKVPPAGGQARERWESLQALHNLAQGFMEQSTDPTPASFLAELDRRAADQHAPVVEGVTLATLHAAKGLEWDAVFLAGICEGSVPITHAQTPEAVEEERRLLYVGITRARRHLSISWAQARSPGQAVRRRPSRFIVPLLPAVLGDHKPGKSEKSRPRKKSRRVSHCRVCQKPLTDAKQRNRGRCDECPSPYDEVLFESLREWRRTRAESDEVPAYVVFSDATLEALAEVKPTTAAALLEISGIGETKLARYGDELLTVLGAAAD
jgi:DNA helicase-2/ATP-dependent DNA helicase PcrA